MEFTQQEFDSLVGKLDEFSCFLPIEDLNILEKAQKFIEYHMKSNALLEFRDLLTINSALREKMLRIKSLLPDPVLKDILLKTTEARKKIILDIRRIHPTWHRTRIGYIKHQNKTEAEEGN